MAEGFTDQGTLAHDNLIAGELRLVAKKVTLASGTHDRGAVLGRVTASGDYVLSAAGAGDGSETPRLVLAHDADASAGPVDVLAFEHGDFNGAALTLGAGHTLASIADGLRGLGIYIHTNIGA